MKMHYKPVLHYKKIIENADLIILSDSSFFCMALNLDIKTDKCYYVVRGDPNYDCDNYDYIYERQPIQKEGNDLLEMYI